MQQKHSENRNIKLLIEIHNVLGIDLYSEVLKLLSKYLYHIEFEKKYPNGERHVLFAK